MNGKGKAAIGCALVVFVWNFIIVPFSPWFGVMLPAIEIDAAIKLISAMMGFV